MIRFFALFIFCFVSFFVIGISAQARTLMPISEWKIHKPVVMDGQATYCTMAREYSTGTIVTFAQNNKGEGTIAFDFKRDALDITRPYPITLQANKVLRQYVVKPVKQSAIIMRTSTDKSLFDAMKQAKELKVTFDTQDFTVDLLGFDDAYYRLTGCVGIIKALDPQNGNLKRAPRGPSLRQEEVRYEKMADKEKQLEMLVKDNVSLMRRLQAERHDFREDVEKKDNDSSGPTSLLNQDLLDDLAKAQDQNVLLLQKIAGLEAQLTDSGTPIVEPSYNPDVDAALQERDSQIARMKAEKERLENLLNQERKQRVSLEADLVKIRASGRSMPSVSDSALVKELERKVNALELQNKDLTQKLAGTVMPEPKIIVKEIIKEVPQFSANTPQEIQGLETRLAEAETMTLSLKAERDEYRNLLQRERKRLKEMNDLGKQLANAGNGETNMVARIDVLEAEKIDLIRQLEFAKKNSGSTHSAPLPNSKTLAVLENKLENLMQDRAQLEQNLKLARQSKQTLEAQLSSLQVELAEMRSAKTDAIRLARSVSRQDNYSNQAEDKKLEAEIDRLIEQNKLLQADLNLAQAKTVKSEQMPKHVETVSAVPVSQSAEEFGKAPLSETIETADPQKTNRDALKSLRSRLAQNAAQPTAVNHKKMQPVIDPKDIAETPTQSPTMQPVIDTVQASLSGDEIRSLVGRSGIPLVSSIERVERVSGPDFAAFQWDTGQVYGSAEQSTLSGLEAFETSIRSYIGKTRQRCNGEFDQTVQALGTRGGAHAKMVDIACVDTTSTGAAASILFVAHNGMFYALAHEADLNSFQIAMDMRDQLAANLSTVF